MLRLYRLNTGSCGGCDDEIGFAVHDADDMEWAAAPTDADALLLTGPLTAGSRDTALRVLREAGATPVLVIGRCAIDGRPFGRGGVKELAEIVTHVQLDGCPPAPQTIADTIRRTLGLPTSAETEEA